MVNNSTIKYKKDTHKSCIVSKEINVDINIAPVVNWLNTFKDVHTLYSCEGCLTKWSPYVLFLISSSNSESKKEINIIIKRFCKENKLRFSNLAHKGKANKYHHMSIEADAFTVWVNYPCLKVEACDSKQPPIGGCNHNFSCFIVRPTGRTPQA